LHDSEGRFILSAVCIVSSEKRSNCIFPENDQGGFMRKSLSKIVALAVVVLAFSMVFAGCQKAGLSSKPITLAQGKPEIDAALKAYAATWSEANKVPVTIKSVGGSSGVDLGTQLKADLAAGDMPDIFAINGLEDYKEWADLALDLSNEPWVKDTSVAFKYDGKVYGFPVAVEGWGMAYNADILAKVSRGLGAPMTGIGMDQIEVTFADRGW